MGFVWMIYGIGLQGPTRIVEGGARPYRAAGPERARRGRGAQRPGPGARRRELLRGVGRGGAGVRGRGLGAARFLVAGVRPGGCGGGHVRRGGRRLRRRRLRGERRVRHRRRALPDVVRLRLPRLPRLLPRAPHVVVELAPIIPTYTEAGRAPAAARDRRDRPAAVRVHGARPRRPPTAGHGARHRRVDHLPHAVLAAAPPRPLRRRPTVPRCRQRTGRWEPDGPVPADRAARRASPWCSASSAWRSRLLAPRRPSRPRRRRTSAASSPAAEPAGAVPGQLLHRRHAVHHVRHRDHLRLPVRGAALVRSGSYGFVAILSSRRVLPHLRLRGRPRWARLGSAAALRHRHDRRRRIVSADAHRRPSTIRRVGTEGRPTAEPGEAA